MDKSKFNVNKSQKSVDDIYALVFARPVSKRISKLLFNTKITPNQITVFSVLLGIISGILLFFDYNYISAVLLYLSFVFDCVDGEVARSREQFTKLGLWLESTSDRIPDLLPIIAMGFLTKNWLLTALAVAVLFLIRTVISANTMLVEKFKLEISSSRKGIYSRNKFSVWFRYTKSAHLMFLVIFMLIKQYTLYLILLSTLGFLYFVVIWVIGIISCRRMDREKRQEGKNGY
jgi:phosphatidylglycerophosphate synthase